MLSLTVSVAGAARAQTGANVLIVINDRSSASTQIGEYYASKRGVPPENILHVSAQPADTVSRADYQRDIEVPLTRWFGRTAAHDRILYIVLTKGVPLRIDGTSGTDGTVSSVDSELTLLYRRMTGARVPIEGRIKNPYFAGETAIGNLNRFTHKSYDTFLVTRLDGFTVQDVMGLIDRGLSPADRGKFVLDQKATLLDRGGDSWLQGAATRLTAMGLKEEVQLDTTTRVVTGVRDVLGYYSWGSNDPAIKQRHFDLTFVPGALAGMFVSSDGRTFEEPPDDWTVGTWNDAKTHFAGSPQSLAGDLIRDGVTGIAAHVAEPFLDGTIRPDVLFPAYVSGFNLAESFYLAMPYLSWQTIVIGDPLCSPFNGPTLDAAQLDPGIDQATDAARYFASRRLQTFARPEWKREAAALIVRAERRLANSDTDGARKALEDSVAADPRIEFAHRALGMLYDTAGEYDKAIERYRSALALTPDDPVVLNNLAYDLGVRKVQPKDALPFAERAFNLVAGNPVIADTLGWIQYLVGNSSAASRLYDDIVKKPGGSAQVHLHAAVVFEAIGRADDAGREFERALELAPELAKSDDAVRLAAKLKGNVTK